MKKKKRKKADKVNRRKLSLQAIRKREAELRKRTFFDPTYDLVFKKIFAKMKTLIHFLNAVLRLEGNRRLVYAKFLGSTINLSRSDKKRKINRFDIHACTADGQFVDVEMQRVGHEDFLDRVELYSAMLSINSKIHMNNELTTEQLENHPYLMPTVYSIWICNFKVDFCTSFHEEIALYRSSDVGKSEALPVYAKKKYIIIDLTRFVPQKENSPESEWLKLFKTMPQAKRAPKGLDGVMGDVYERMKVKNATSKFIKKVALYMERDERLTRLGTARREAKAEGFAEGEVKGEAKGIAKVMKLLRAKRASPDLIAAVSAALAIK